MSARIVQLTDLHLYQDPARVLAGIATWDTFNSVLAQVRSTDEEPDYVILTGDLAQDEALPTYLMLREALGDWMERCKIIPGNHDDRENIRKAFPELFPQGDGTLNFVVEAGGWRIIGLDSHVPGEVTGCVDGAQLTWLRTELESNPHAPALLFVHHPPIPIDVAWIDELGLEEAAGLVELIESSPTVKVVCAGHVHQEYVGHIGTAAMYTTPSTCVQFGARAEKSFDASMAGYRSFTLAEDGYHTEVHRLTAVATGNSDRKTR